MEYVIYDMANGNLQWQGEAESEMEAWKLFRADLGYSEDIPGVCERSAYIVETSANFEAASLDK